MLRVHSILQSFLLCLTSVLVTAKVRRIKRRAWVRIDNTSDLVDIVLLDSLIVNEISAAYVMLLTRIIVQMVLTTRRILLYNDIQGFLQTLSLLLLTQSHSSINRTWVTTSLTSQVGRWFGPSTIASPVILHIHLGHFAHQIHVFLMQHKESIEVNAAVGLVERWGHAYIFVTEHEIIDCPEHRFVLNEINQNFLFSFVRHPCKCFLCVKHLADVSMRLRCFICWTAWI